MESYTYMSDEGIQAVIRAMRKTSINPETMSANYDMSLNSEDFAMIMKVLQFVWSNAMNSTDEGDLAVAAGDFASSIAETLGVEFI